uniref:Putative secreted protein n=1 Tax=Ixodes ricinus TaxID=34613 RepID=A0A6B0UTL0_IXORI
MLGACRCVWTVLCWAGLSADGSLGAAPIPWWHLMIGPRRIVTQAVCICLGLSSSSRKNSELLGQLKGKELGDRGGVEQLVRRGGPPQPLLLRARGAPLVRHVGDGRTQRHHAGRVAEHPLVLVEVAGAAQRRLHLVRVVEL